MGFNSGFKGLNHIGNCMYQELQYKRYAVCPHSVFTTKR